MVFIDPIQAKPERITLSKSNSKTNPFLIREKRGAANKLASATGVVSSTYVLTRAVVVIDRMTV
jgi:hypothetical protein